MELYLDMNPVIEWARGRNAELVARFDAVDPKRIALSFVVEAELRVGIAKGPSYGGAQRVLRFLNEVRVVHSNSDIVEAYIQIRTSLETIGMRIGDGDLWIAATALVENATLVTNNVREFSRISGLRIEDWTT